MLQKSKVNVNLKLKLVIYHISVIKIRDLLRPDTFNNIYKIFFWYNTFK